jgi:hypothetical protein
LWNCSGTLICRLGFIALNEGAVIILFFSIRQSASFVESFHFPIPPFSQEQIFYIVTY